MMNIEKIREGVWQILHSHEKYEEWSVVVSDIFSYLAEKGACFPVEGELPISDWEETPASTVYHDGQMDMLEAGYIKVITLKEMMGADK